MTVAKALRDINGAILDVQRADFDTWSDPLRRIAHTLGTEPLKRFRDELTVGADLDAFLSEQGEPSSGFGGATVRWPVEREPRLGLSILLIERAATDPSWLMNFGFEYYKGSSSKIIETIRKVMNAVVIPFGRDFKDFVEDQSLDSRNIPSDVTELRRIFIVHGHDDGPRETVARFISNLGLDPVILHEQASKGMTVPEKLVVYGNVGFAIVLLTPDDLGRSKSELGDSPRARQNVLLELGYFIGRLGRDKVVALRKGVVEIPSDYVGVVYLEFDAHGGWRRELAKELKAAGYDIDFNKVMSVS